MLFLLCGTYWGFICEHDQFLWTFHVYSTIKARDKEITLKLCYFFVYVLLYPYVLSTFPWFIPISSNLLKLLIHYCLILCYRYGEIWCQTNFLFFVSDLVIFLGGSEDYFFFFSFLFFLNLILVLSKICTEVDHSGLVLLDTQWTISLCTCCKCVSILSLKNCLLRLSF